MHAVDRDSDNMLCTVGQRLNNYGLLLLSRIRFKTALWLRFGIGLLRRLHVAAKPPAD